MTTNVALIGVGNVAAALAQGLYLYTANSIPPIGTLSQISEVKLSDIKLKLGFDVNRNKVGKDISEAIFIPPNCAQQIARPVHLSAPVLKGPILDGLESNIRHHIQVDEQQEPADISSSLQEHQIDVVVILLPTGSNRAACFYAKEAIKAGCAVVNGMPALIANDPELVSMAQEAKVPLIGDDVKSQIGATIVHRNLSKLFPMRGAVLDRTIQLDWGGDMDFCNLTSNGRYEQGKRQSKTEAVIEHLPNKDDVEVQVSAVDYIPFLKNQKEAYTRIEGRIFGGMPVRIDVMMQVEDGYNSAGIIADMIRVAAIGRSRGIGGVLDSAASFFNKKPPQQLDDEQALTRMIEFLNGTRER